MEKRVRAKDRFREMAKLSARLAREKKAQNIVILDVRKLSFFTGYLLLCSGMSEVHVDTIQAEVHKGLKEKGFIPKNIEGQRAARWILMDYGGLVVNVFYPETRCFYNLERLWDGARKVSWQIRKRKKND